MTSSITTDERDGTGAQERHWQPVPCFYLYRLCGDRGDDSSDPMDQSFSGSPFTRSHDGRACRPPQHHRAWGRAWRSELKMLSPPTLSLHLELDLLTAIPSRPSSLVFWRTHWAGADAGQAAHGTESWEAGEPRSDCLQVPQAGTGRVLLRNRSLRARSSLILCQDAAASGWPLLLCL